MIDPEDFPRKQMLEGFLLKSEIVYIADKLERFGLWDVYIKSDRDILFAFTLISNTYENHNLFCKGFNTIISNDELITIDSIINGLKLWAKTYFNLDLTSRFLKSSSWTEKF